MAAPDGAWIVEGVDRAAHESAHRAAAAAGMTVGAWVEQAIRARQPGASPAAASAPVDADALRSAIDAEFHVSKDRIDSGLRPMALALHALALRLAAGRGGIAADRPKDRTPRGPRSPAPEVAVADRPGPRQPGDDGRLSGPPLPPWPAMTPGGVGFDLPPIDAPRTAGPAPDRAGQGPASDRRSRRSRARRAVAVLVLVAIGVYVYAGPLGLGHGRSAFNDAVAIRAATAWQTIEDASGEAVRAVLRYLGTGADSAG